MEINSVSSILNGNEGFLGALFVFDEEEREIELTDNEDEISLRINCNDDAKKNWSSWYLVIPDLLFFRR